MGNILIPAKRSGPLGKKHGKSITCLLLGKSNIRKRRHGNQLAAKSLSGFGSGLFCKGLNYFMKFQCFKYFFVHRKLRCADVLRPKKTILHHAHNNIFAAVSTRALPV